VVKRSSGGAATPERYLLSWRQRIQDKDKEEDKEEEDKEETGVVSRVRSASVAAKFSHFDLILVPSDYYSWTLRRRM